MTRDDLIFTEHAVDRMAERGILVRDVIAVVSRGDVIEVSTLVGRPFPVIRSLGFVGPTPLHVLWADHRETGKTLIITAYVPDATRWHPDFRRRKP